MVCNTLTCRIPHNVFVTLTPYHVSYNQSSYRPICYMYYIHDSYFVVCIEHHDAIPHLCSSSCIYNHAMAQDTSVMIDPLSTINIVSRASLSPMLYTGLMYGLYA